MTDATKRKRQVCEFRQLPQGEVQMAEQIEIGHRSETQSPPVKYFSGISSSPAGSDPGTCVPCQAEQGCFDWTRQTSSVSLSPHIRFALSIDWASTPLGPIDSWSWDLRLMYNLIMSCSFSAAFYWGDELFAIYNEAYIPMAGKKHSGMMGMRYRDAWAEI
jgi:hypothetical protein